MQQLASDQNKSKRKPFFDIAIVDWITKIVWQATTYTKIFSNGYHRLILGRTIIWPANHATTSLHRGSFRATRSKNGKRPRPRVPFYGLMENVRYCAALTLLQTEVFPFCSGRGKKHFLVRQSLDIPFSGTYRVG
jgi:hypothetical protein